MNKILAIVAVILAPSVAGAEMPVYQDENATVDERVADLLGRMTVEEKVSLLCATSYEIDRLGLGKYYHGNEALHGVVRPGRFTVFPQAIALASSWNPALMHRVSPAISDEARARWNELDQGRLQTEQFSDVLTFWSPTVNMARDPRWGRTPETYGEDPYLTGVMGTAFVRGLQGDDPRYLKVVSTPKHFAANNEEHNRFECNAMIGEKQLREYYLPAFEACIRDGKAASIMTAYNAVNDVPCTANPYLLNHILRDEWGFDGYVVSDCGAPGLLRTNHKYVKTREAAAMIAIKAGLDLECGDDIFRDPLLSAYRQHMVSDADIDSAAARVLRARVRLGLLDKNGGKNNPYTSIPVSVVGSPEHRDVALQSAREGIVLLKNSRNMLPLNKKKIKSIAVVGINAGSCEFGDYSGAPVSEPVSVFQGIRDKVGDNVKVNYARWKSAADGLELISGEYFPDGLKAEYFSGMDFSGTPKVRTEDWVNFEPVNQAPDPFLPKSPISVRWSGTLRPVVSGEYVFSLTSDDGSRLYIDDQLVVDGWGYHPVQTDSARYSLEAGRDYKLRVDYYDSRDYAACLLKWRVPADAAKSRLDLFGEAGEAVRNSDVVVAVMGINKTIEREGQDRSSISLPADQLEFLQEIAKVNPNIVLVLVAGSPLAINWEKENIPAIVNAWYPGEQGGTAVADVLFGDYNPAGRLPLTYYKSIDDLPAFDDYDVTKGRTYKYFQGEPLYPFGYGLSYTTFKYDRPVVEDKGETIDVTFNLKNTGRRDGDEVAQLYVKMPEYGDGAVAPVRELKGFSRVHLKAGQQTRVTIPVSKHLLRYWDVENGCFVTPRGQYTIEIGASSSDIRATTTVTL